MPSNPKTPDVLGRGRSCAVVSPELQSDEIQNYMHYRECFACLASEILDISS